MNYNAGMLKLCLALIVGLLAVSVVAAQAESDRTPVPLKPTKVPERGLELPFDFKTETNIILFNKN